MASRRTFLKDESKVWPIIFFRYRLSRIFLIVLPSALRDLPVSFIELAILMNQNRSHDYTENAVQQHEGRADNLTFNITRSVRVREHVDTQERTALASEI